MCLYVSVSVSVYGFVALVLAVFVSVFVCLCLRTAGWAEPRTDERTDKHTNRDGDFYLASDRCGALRPKLLTHIVIQWRQK